MRTLRSRIVVAMIVLVVGVLAVSALLTFAFAQRAAVQSARDDLTRKAPDVRDQIVAIEQRLDESNTPRAPAIRAVLASTLLINDAHVVEVDDAGRIGPGTGLFSAREAQLTAAQREVLSLPNGVRASDLDVEALRAGERQIGRNGRTMFAAESIPLDSNAKSTPVLVMTKSVDTRPFAGIGPTYALVALGATTVALLVAILLARRLTRPVDELRRTAHQLAGGDLTVRADVGRADDELTELARTLNSMATELEVARGQERAFLMSVSHDLRTPLTSIRGYAEALADGTIDDPAARDRAAAVIRAEAGRLERLVRDLLDLARLDAHEFSLHPGSIDAGDVVRSAVDAFGPAAVEAGVTLSVTATPIRAHADPVRLGQIVGNLTENALKYATTLVQVSASAAGTDLMIAVDDDGPGIPEDELPRAFERLYTSRATAGRALGTGLGLAIVRELATAMGGHARAERLPTGGTRSWVVLPVVETAVPTRP